MTEAKRGDAESLFPEVRFVKDAPEVRQAAEGPGHIVGYASVFGKLSRKLGGFVERVNPGCFDEARSLGYPDVVCRYNHRDDMVLGTTNAKTCVLEIDERGLKYDVLPPRSRADVLELVQRGDVMYSSFAFRCKEDGGDEWGLSEFGLPLRDLRALDLCDVAPVMDPAYKDTSAMARNLSGAVASLAKWVDAEPSEVRSMMEAGQAVKFFKRTDRKPVPALTPSAAEERQTDVLDDTATAIRSTKPEKEENRTVDTDKVEERKVLSSAARKALPDSDFAYIEPGGAKVNGRTKPNKLRHYPVHDAPHVRDALARIAQGKKFAAEAAPKVHAAAGKFGIGMHDPMERALVYICEQRMNEFLAAEEARKAAEVAESAKPEETRSDEPKTLTAAEAMMKMAELRTSMLSEYELDSE